MRGRASRGTGSSSSTGTGWSKRVEVRRLCARWRGLRCARPADGSSMICPLPASFLSSPSSSHCTLPYVSSCCLLCCACFAVGSPPSPPGHYFPHRHVLGHCLHRLSHYRSSTPPSDPPLGSRPHLACTIIVSFSFSPPLLCLVSSSPATSPLCIEFRTPRYLSTISLRYHALLTVSEP